MTEIQIIDVPTIKREVKIEKATHHKLLNQVKEEAQVIIHCSYTGTMWGDKIRIWKSTFLYAKNSIHRSKLVDVKNITMHPAWMNVDRGQTVNFTLIFTGLPKHCKQFDMIEKIPEPGGFVIKKIERNNSDVYLLDIT
ncbi:MAG: hypothetical protein WCH59_04410 [Chitinophagia bacterium]|jgi:endonuclease IV